MKFFDIFCSMCKYAKLRDPDIPETSIDLTKPELQHQNLISKSFFDKLQFSARIISDIKLRFFYKQF